MRLTTLRNPVVVVLIAGLAAPPVAANQGVPGESDAPQGPESGALVAVGGGAIGEEILNAFFELAGGKDAPIVLIPTAGVGDDYTEKWSGYRMFASAGATNLTILHTRDRDEASSDAFVEPLREARGVWFGGGRQWRLVDSYLDTKTHDALWGVLKRGGVIGGSSAGATIQASYLVRGAREGNHIMMAPGYEQGLGFLHNAAIDQHLLTRGRERDLLEVVDAHPNLLGIGIDESTAVIVKGSRLRVVGESKVAIYDARRFAPSFDHYLFLEPGDGYDLNLALTVPSAASGNDQN